MYPVAGTESQMLKKLIKSTLSWLGYELRSKRHASASRKSGGSSASLYRPLYSPWCGEPEFMSFYSRGAHRTLVSTDRAYIIFVTLQQAMKKAGNVFECGVYKGGTAAMIAAYLASVASPKKLYLFDTFEGMPSTDEEKDLHKAGDFADTSLESVAEFIGFPEQLRIIKGFIPQSFDGLEDSQICFAHIDLDIYRSILDALEFIWPRLAVGGVLVFDDYGFPTCPGAKSAVDEFFDGTDAIPICLPTGQAIVFKS
jgi:O-methyltransferase